MSVRGNSRYRGSTSQLKHNRTTASIGRGGPSRAALRIRAQRLPNAAALALSGTECLGTCTVIDGRDIAALVQDLQQHANAELLSAPKVTTLSGNTAMLRVVAERFVPDTWTEPVLAAGDGEAESVDLPPSLPEFGKDGRLGVILEVTPTVAGDGGSIHVELLAEVVCPLDRDDGKKEGATAEFTLATVTYRLPVNIVVWDGETVVVGCAFERGISLEADAASRPADTPTGGEAVAAGEARPERDVLLVFATVRLVNPAGVPIRANDMRGLPSLKNHFREE